MSLINEALKKAQKQRTGEAPALGSMPNIGGEQPQQISRRAKPASFTALLVRLGLGAAALLVVIVGGILLLRGKSAPEASPVATPQQVVSAPAVKPAEQPVAPVAKTEAPAKTVSTPAKAAPAPAVAKSPENVFVLPIAPPPEAPKTAAVTPKAEPKPVAATPVAQPQPELPVPAKPAGRLEPRAIQYIENLKVAGIRISGNDSKVLMNDRVYRVGNTIEHELGLKLVEITANSLTFEDERGGRYTRNF